MSEAFACTDPEGQWIADMKTEIPSVDYHADRVADVPTLSRSVAHILCQSTPLHALWAHPRLSPNYQREESAVFDVGSIVHRILLEGTEDGIEIVDANDWRTNAAKEARDDARNAGRIAILAKDFDRVRDMVEAAKTQLADQPIPLLVDGRAEQTLVWEDLGATCRARLDWLTDDHTRIVDYKTAADANPARWTRGPLYAHGLDLQAAMYRRGVSAVFGIKPPHFYWVVQEKTPPYALSVIRPGEDVLAVGVAKYEWACRKWAECLKSGVWPGYGTDVTEAELPAWADDAKWLAYDEEVAA